jgi:uncharacterized membrane protein YedE/YeeE
MQIDWAHFTPAASLGGGLLIGIAAAGLLLVNGRILGVSGILGGLIWPRSGDLAWRVAFVIGLIMSPTVLRFVLSVTPPVIETGFFTLVVAGLLVGIGTRLGAGCTSGHGICGVSRLSPRSLVATGAFMLAGFATVFVVRHVIG